MSRGPGRVEQAIMAAIEAEPDNAFTVEDLCDRVYQGVNRIEKKHRVAVIRAMRNAAERPNDLEFMTGEGRGNTLVLFNRYNVPSYAMARLKADKLNYYRTKDDHLSVLEQEARLRAELQPGSRIHSLNVEGGAWMRHVRLWTAQRDGDKKLIRAIEAEEAKRMDALLKKFRGIDKTIIRAIEAREAKRTAALLAKSRATFSPPVS